MTITSRSFGRAVLAAIGIIVIIIIWGWYASPERAATYSSPAPGYAPLRHSAPGLPDPTPTTRHTPRPVSAEQALIRRMRDLITADVYPEIAWHIVRDDEVFVGFSRWQRDGPAVVLAIAREADKVVRQVEGDIAGNATVWAVRANADRRNLPGRRCYYWATTDEGWVETSDGKRFPARN